MNAKEIFNENGLSDIEQKLILNIAQQIFNCIEEKTPWAIKRCNFFVDNGYKHLINITKDNEKIVDQNIKGSDANPFDQHYWLEFKLKGVGDKTIIIDPIFKYLGLKNCVDKTKDNFRYYEKGRIINPNKPVWEGGIRIKTMGI